MSTISTIVIRRGVAGADGTAGPAPSGTGFVKVTSGVLDTPSATIPHTSITGLGTAATAALLDSDTMTGATATNVPSAESVVAYVAANASGGSDTSQVIAGSSMTWEGDSLTAGGAYIPSGKTFRELVYSEFSTKATGGSTLTGSGGSTFSSMSARYAASVYPLRPAVTGSARAILFVMIGVNDLGTMTPATYITSLESYWQTAKNDGFYVVAMTVPISQSESSAKSIARADINSKIRRSVIPDLIVDTGSLFSIDATTTHFYDTLHPNESGQKKIAQLIIETLRGKKAAPIDIGSIASQGHASVNIVGGLINNVAISGGTTTVYGLTVTTPTLLATNATVTAALNVNSDFSLTKASGDAFATLKATAAGSGKYWRPAADAAGTFSMTHFDGTTYRSGMFVLDGSDGSILFSGTVVGGSKIKILPETPTANRTYRLPNAPTTSTLNIVGVITKTDTGDPASGYEGQEVINTFDNTLKKWADGAWRTLSTW